MVVVDAPGPAEFIEPVIPLLKKAADILLVTVNTSTNAPYNILRKFNPIRADHEKDARQIYELFNPDTLAVATSSLVLGPYVNNEFTRLAHEHGARIICFQDFWANHRWPMNFKMMKYWNKVLAPDKLAKKFFLEDGYQGEIVITGNPNFDRFAKVNKEKERRWLRKKFDLNESDFVIFYVGRGTPTGFKYDEITFKFFADVLRKAPTWRWHRQVRVIIRPHPRDENPKRYRKFAGKLNILDTSEFPSSDDLLLIADLVIGIHSAHHIQACYLRIPAICILLPNAGKIMLEKISLTDFPPNAVGANIGIYHESESELRSAMKKIISDKKFVAQIQGAQKKYFPLPKTLAAKKVAEEILC